MRLSDISDTKTLRAGFPDICRAIKEKETDMEVTEKNRTKYRMPGEFEPHEGCVMIWPERPGSWNYGAREAQKAFVKVAEAIGVSEKVYMLVSKAQMENAKNQLGNVSGVTLLECETDDAWARDVGATMVLDEKGAVCGVDWQFNAGEVPLTGFTGTGKRMTGWLPLSAGLSVVHVWMPDLLCWRAVPSILTERGL